MAESAKYDMRFDDMVTNAIRRVMMKHPNVIDDSTGKQFSLRMEDGVFVVYEEKTPPVKNKSALTVFKTGSYTGDGTTSMKVTGIGFKPKYVKIWTKETAGGTSITAFETTDVIIDDHASGGAYQILGITSNTFEIDKIISLDTDGFTVDDAGGDNHPNKSDQVYNYSCIG